MACPHAAGVVALLKSHKKDLTFTEVKKYLNEGAEQRNLTQTGRNCGGITEDIFPNHAFGIGRINAYQSLKKLVGV